MFIMWVNSKITVTTAFHPLLAAFQKPKIMIKKVSVCYYCEFCNNYWFGFHISVLYRTKTGNKKQKKNLRIAGGQVWVDPTLEEWDPNDFRIFCGDLGNDVGDEVLTKAFSRFASFVKAKVVRDKKTNKSRGYGFVSFKDPLDFSRAIKEMDGRYLF